MMTMRYRLTFTPGDDVTHHLTLNGEPVASVGRILRSAGFERDFSNIPEHHLTHARERGRYVDECIQLLDAEELDWSQVHPEAVPYLNGYQKFRREKRWTTHWNQPILYHPQYEYGGLADLIGGYEGQDQLHVLDVKCVAKIDAEAKRTYGLQLAAYTMGGIHLQPSNAESLRRLRRDDEHTSRAILWLKKDGKYQLIACEDQDEYAAFLSAAVLHRLKQKWAA